MAKFLHMFARKIIYLKNKKGNGQSKFLKSEFNMHAIVGGSVSRTFFDHKIENFENI